MGDFDHLEMLAKANNNRLINDQCFDALSRYFTPILASDIRHALKQMEVTGRDVVVRTMGGRVIHVYNDLVDKP